MTDSGVGRVIAPLYPGSTVDSSGRLVRHPCEVTADRLANHTEKYADQLTPNELRAFEAALNALGDIASGRRA